MNRIFRYTLIEIKKSPPIPIPNLATYDGKPFKYDCETKEQKTGIDFIVHSHVVADIDGLKVFQSTSKYFIPFEQPTPGVISNNIYTELIYQHLARETDMVFNVSQANVVLTMPTLQEVADTFASKEN